MYTLAKAILNAKKKNVKISFQGYCKKDGRRIFFVPSTSKENLFHPVHHTGSCFECDCDSYKNTKMCVHVGCVVLYMTSLHKNERTQLLTPRKNILVEAQVVLIQTQEKKKTAAPEWMMR